MNRFARTAVVMVCALILSGGLYGQDAKTVQAARDVLKKHADSVVWISGVMKMRITAMGREFGKQESTIDAVGTVIDESGLTVVSAMLLDPGAMMSGMNVGTGGGDSVKLDIKTELSELKLRLADGTEVPAKLVLKDEDLDLAFVMPDAESEAGKKMVGKYSWLKLDKAPAVEVLDEMIVLTRLGKKMDRQPSVQIGRISAVVKKPRTFYHMVVPALGTPAFSADGKVVGLLVMRKDSLDLNNMGSIMSMASSGGLSPVLLPAEDVQDIARQALAKKPTTQK